MIQIRRSLILSQIQLALLSLPAVLPANAIAQEMTGSSYASVMRENAPQDFKELFTPKKKIIQLTLINGNALTINMLVSNYHVQLYDNDKVSAAALREFLLNNGIAKQAAETAVNELTIGVDSDQNCKGDRLSCQVNVPADQPLAVVVGESGDVVRLIFNEHAYSKNAAQAEYVSAHNKNNALINSPTLYSSYFNNETNVTLNNKTVVGLPYGNIRSEFTTSSNDGHMDNTFQNLVYDLEMDKYRIVGGRSQNFDTLNSTSLLSFSSIIRDGVYVLSSRNLARQPQNSYQRLYFYMPQNGAAEVWRDGKIIFSKTTEAGQQFISYSDFPAGNYMVTLKLKTDNVVLSEQNSHIVNTNDFALNTGDVDFSTGVSRTHQDGYNTDDISIGEGDVMYRMLDTVMVGGGVATSDNDQLYKLGGKWFPLDDLSFTGAVGAFSNNARYYTSIASFKNLTLTYNRYDTAGSENQYGYTYYAPNNQNNNNVQNDYFYSESNGNKSSSLSDVLLGTSGYEQVMLSSNYALGPGNGYVSVMYQKNDYGGSDTSGKNIGYNVGYNTPFMYNSILGMNLAINNYKNTVQGDEMTTESWNLSLNLSIPLGERTTSQLSAYYDKNNHLSTDASLQKSFQFNDTSTGSLSVGGNQNSNENYGRVNGSLSTQQKSFNLSGSASATSQASSNSSVFVNMSGSQIIDTNGLYFTNTQRESYLLIHDDTPEAIRKEAVQQGYNGKIITRPQAQLQLGNGNKIDSSTDYYAKGGSQVIPLNLYQSHMARLNSSAFGVYNLGDNQRQIFSFPGTTLSLNTNFQQEYQVIGAFYQANGGLVSELQCEGQSCVRVEKLDEGLFKIILKGQLDYQLKSASQLCYSSDMASLKQTITRLSRMECQALPKGKGPSSLAEKGVGPLQDGGKITNVTPTATAAMPDTVFRFGRY